MSKYFYIFNEGTGKCLGSNAKGDNNQLWKWDEEGRLVNKLGLVADICGADKDPGAKVIIFHQHDGSNQKWRVEEGVIKSSMNDLAMDASDFEIKMQKPGDSSNQRWEFVPEVCLEDYNLMQKHENPLTESVFWKNVADNYLEVIIGYTINEYESGIKKAVAKINECADQLDKVEKDTGIAQIVGGGTGIIGGVMAISGLIAAPFTLGASLTLTAAGAAIGVAGAATSLTSTIVSSVWNNSQTKEVKEITAPLFNATMKFQGFLNQYIEKLKAADEFLKTEEGGNIAKDAYTVFQMVQDGGKIAWNTYKIGSVVVETTQHVKHARALKALIDFIQADYYAVNGARLAMATNAAAPGLAIPRVGSLFAGRTLVAAGTTTAKVLSVGMSVFGIAFGIWDVVEGAKSIDNGSELAGGFRESGKNLNEESEKLINLYKELQD